MPVELVKERYFDEPEGVSAYSAVTQDGRIGRNYGKNNFKRKKKPGVVRRILPYFVIILGMQLR